MKLCTGFWAGMSAGLLAGAAMGMLTPSSRTKAQMGKRVRKLGDAMEQAVDSILSEIR